MCHAVTVLSFIKDRTYGSTKKRERSAQSIGKLLATGAGGKHSDKFSQEDGTR